jgi:RNA polymerase sigma-70 factor (sigma-E family)
MVAMMGRGEGTEAVTATAPAAAELHSSSPAGFDTLFDTYFERAVRLAWLLAPGDPSAAEDVAADAIARVWPKWAKGRVDDFWPYLRVAVVNQVHGRGRRFAIAQRRAGDAASDDLGDFEVAVVNRQVLADALRALPTRQRTAVVLRYYEDLSEAESARAMGCSVGTVKSTTARGLLALRARLGSNNDDE